MAFLPPTAARLATPVPSFGWRLATARGRLRRPAAAAATPRRRRGPPVASASSSSSSSSSFSSSSSSAPQPASSPAAAAAAAAAAATAAAGEECFDVLDAAGAPTGRVKARSRVHADGDWHRSVHVWLARVAPDAAPLADGNGARHGRAGEPADVVDTLELLLQLRGADKDTYPGRWDVSAAGHIAAGDGSADTARREVAEELGLHLPAGRIGGCRFTARSDSRGSTAAHGAFVDREHQDVYAVVVAAGEVEALQGGGGWAVQAAEVDRVAWVPAADLRRRLAGGDTALVPRGGAYVEGLWAALRELAQGA